MKILFLILGFFQLQNIAYATNADAAAQARNVLCFFFEECMPPNAGVPQNTTSGRMIQITNPKLELIKQLSTIQVYPNPATDYVTFEYHLPEYLESSQLTVTDITGKTIHHKTLTGFEGQYLWDTRPIDSGFYFYVLKNDKGEIILSGKISIIK
jgi:predicted secreted protein